MVSQSLSLPRNLHQDTVAGLVFFVVTSIYAHQVFQLSLPFSRDQAGPAFYPMILSIVMYICSVTLIYRGVTAADTTEITIELERFVRPAAYIMVTVGYALTLITIGYGIATVAHTFLVTVLFEYGERPPRQVLLFSSGVAIGVTVLGYVFFELIFNIRLPSGVFI